MSLDPGALGFALESLQTGHAPFWDPRLSCGIPLFAALGQGMAYPGILLRLSLPLEAAWIAYACFHIVLTWQASRSVEFKPIVHWSLIIAVTFAGFVLEPAWVAALTWAVWIEAAERRRASGLLRSALWALALSCGAWFLTVPHATWSLLRSKAQARSMVLALLWVAPAWLPSIFLILRAEEPWQGLLPRMQAWTSQPVITVESRLHGGRLAVAAAASSQQRKAWASRPGLALVFGSPWALASQAEQERLASSLAPGHDNALSLAGAAWVWDAESQGQAWRSPVMAALVGSAVAAPSKSAQRDLASPVFSRALRVDGGSLEAKGLVRWQLLPAPKIYGDGFELSFDKVAEFSWAFASVSHDGNWFYEEAGRWQPAMRAEAAYLAAPLGAGQGLLRFRYQPPAWILSLALGLLGLVLVHFPGLQSLFLRGRSLGRMR